MKIQRTLILSVSTLVLLSTLSGCSTIQFTGVSQAKSQVSNYNSLVTKTLSNYSKSKALAIKDKKSLLSFITADKSTSVVPSNIVNSVKPLTSKQIINFQGYVVAYDNYFTALGAKGVREILIINSGNSKMYATVLWNTKGIYALSRTVVQGK